MIGYQLLDMEDCEADKAGEAGAAWAVVAAECGA